MVFSSVNVMRKLTEHGQQFYVHVETAHTEIGMRMRVRMLMRLRTTCIGSPSLIGHNNAIQGQFSETFLTII